MESAMVHVRVEPAAALPAENKQLSHAVVDLVENVFTVSELTKLRNL